MLTQIRTFMGQLDANKESIVAVLENTNRLAVQLKKQDGTIKSALDDIPNALRSVNRQRDDLVKLLEALERLSGVGVRVIRASKESTINSLRHLAPVLEGFAKAGQNFPKSFQVFLTYPFVDEAIGRDPQVASNLHMGDYTNLSVNLDIDVTDLPLPGLPGLPGEVCDTLAELTKNAKAAANQLVNPTTFPTPPFTAKNRRDIRDRIVKRLLDEFNEQCKAPESRRSPGGRQRLAGGRVGQLGSGRPDRPDPGWPRWCAGQRHGWTDRGHRRHRRHWRSAPTRRPRQGLPEAAGARPVRSGGPWPGPGDRHHAPAGGG